MKRHALFVGVDQYADPTIQNLAFPTKDANDLAGAFEWSLKFDRVEKLLGPEHADDILDVIGDMTRGLGPGDLFFFFFAGHGFRVKDNHVLVCAKDNWGDLEDEDAGLRVGRLKKKLRGPWNRMIVLDACQNDIRATRGADCGVTARDLSLIHDGDAAARLGEGVQILVTSCSEGQKALEVADLRHGLFTSAFLETVKTFADGHMFLDPGILKDDLSSRMQSLAARYRLVGNQEPMFTIPGNTRVVLLDGVSAPPLPHHDAPAAQPQHPTTAPSCAVLEADVLRRKLSLSRALKSVSAADRTDKEFSKFIGAAEDEMAVAEEAIRLDKFSAAAESLDRVESALDGLRKARSKREMDESKANKGADLVAGEKDDAAKAKAEEEAGIAKEKAEEDEVRPERVEAARKPDGRYSEIVGGLTWNFEIKGGKATLGSESSDCNNKVPATTTRPEGRVYIPSVLGGWPVTSIGEFAFAFCSGLMSVTIPNSVTSIALGAFEGCSGLTSVTIPASVTNIGPLAFLSCGLTSVMIPDSVTSIGNSAFCGCSGLTSVTIPASVTNIGSLAFCRCSGLTSVTIPDSVTSIALGAFEGCSGLTSVTIPNSVTSIGGWAFQGCSSLTSVTIPSSVTSIGEWAFKDCSGLTSVTIPNSVTSIGEWAFQGCIDLDFMSKSRLSRWPRCMKN